MRDKNVLQHVCMATIAAVLLGLPSSGQAPAPAQPLGPVVNKSAAPLSVPPGTHELTADDLSAYLDGILPLQLKQEDIAGAVVLVIKDGKVLFQKGYGYADVEKKTPMTPDATLIRPGSVSKLFTWTAVMQQVEQGKIDLDRNVNDYLDFKIPDKFGKPITMRNLMTHTAGFEETIKDLISQKPNQMSIRQYLVTHMPERIYAPGTVPAYSNYGATLAGYIVQRVSGVPFEEYVAKNIFEPLGMQHSTFLQPLPPSLAPLMSKGYRLATEKPKPFEIIGAVPAGSASTSADDISHFMLAHLEGGAWNGARILKPETVDLMHSPQFAANPALPHMCLGFYEETRNGHRIIGHGGDTQYFHSDLHLIQDANVGFFISYNSVGRGDISPRTVLFDAFLDRYFPYTVPSAPAQPHAVADAKQVAGEYISSRRGESGILSFFWMLSNLRVTPKPDGTIVSDAFKSEDQVPKIWQEIGPLIYREKDGQDTIAFSKNPSGQMILAVDYPFEVSMRVGLLDTKEFNLFLIILVAVVSIATLIFWPLAAGIRRHYGRPLAVTREQRGLRWAIRIVALLDLIYMGSWMLLLGGGEPLFDASLDPKLRLIQLIGWLGSLGTIVVIYAVVKRWRAPGEWKLSRLGNVLIVLSALSFSWFLFYWHLLHFSLMY